MHTGGEGQAVTTGSTLHDRRVGLSLTGKDMPLPLAAWVDPNDLAACFGPGVRLKAVTLEITRAEVTEGVVGTPLSWLGPYQEPHLIPGDGRIADIPFGMTVAHGAFRGESRS